MCREPRIREMAAVKLIQPELHEDQDGRGSGLPGSHGIFFAQLPDSSEQKIASGNIDS